MAVANDMVNELPEEWAKHSKVNQSMYSNAHLKTRKIQFSNHFLLVLMATEILKTT